MVDLALTLVVKGHRPGGCLSAATVAGVWLAGGTQSEILRHVTQRKILKNNNNKLRNNTTQHHNASESTTSPRPFDNADLGPHPQAADLLTPRYH
jgi:hypothetical protein